MPVYIVEETTRYSVFAETEEEALEKFKEDPEPNLVDFTETFVYEQEGAN